MITGWPEVTVCATMVVARGKMQKDAGEAHKRNQQSNSFCAVMVQR